MAADREITEENKMANIEQNESALRRFFTEIWSQGNLETADEIMEPDFQFILAFARTETLDAFKQMVVRNRQAFENLTYVPNDVVATETKGAGWWTMTSKHVDTWRNVPGSNQDVAIDGVTFFWFSPAGKLQRAVVHNDVLGLMRQIGGVQMVYEG
jgi:steroid delta-isomerase-like uncharacterized protein